MSTGTGTWLRRWQTLVPRGELVMDEATRAAHAGDRWFASRLPEAVALPRSVGTVSKLLRLAKEDRVPITARGTGYGYVGGCVPAKGGVVLSLARMNRIKEISRSDFVAVVGPGVITKTLQDRCERVGLYYPPDPASRADCSIGGNLATNAGGPRCLKYGVTRDYVLGIEVVLAGGEVIRLGGRTHKNKTGFDLARLFVGSEGLLGVITEATLKLLPLPPYRACLAAGFASMRVASRALAGVFSAGYLPSALEIADEFTVAAAARRTGSRLLAGCRAYLIVELDGHERSVRSEIGDLEAVLRAFEPVTMRRGLGTAGCEKFWAMRREFSFALRDTGLTKLNEDVVVPRGRLEELFRFTARLQKRHGISVACFGHAGDGNIHVNLMVDQNDAEMVRQSRRALDELFDQILGWGGVITGEHGIGLAKKRWWPQAVSVPGRNLHRAIKRALDPAGILNPGKFV
jgi:glycolate oxidase